MRPQTCRSVCDIAHGRRGATQPDMRARAVQRKLRLLLMPYLRHYDYLRHAENMATSTPTMKPPREDLYAPDLYVPLHAMCTYVVLSAWNRYFAGPFAPEVMYNMARP